MYDRTEMGCKAFHFLENDSFFKKKCIIREKNHNLKQYVANL